MIMITSSHNDFILVMEIAEIASRYKHQIGIDYVKMNEGHSDPWKECQHPHCKAVRETKEVSQ